MDCWRFSYQTIVRYSAPIDSHHFMLRCTPRSEGGQRVVEFGCELLSSAKVYDVKDSFGNDVLYGSMLLAHDLFVLAVRGVVECGEYAYAAPAPEPMYRAPSQLTHLDPAMTTFDAQISKSGSACEQALSISEAIYNRMRYAPAETTTETTAQQSFALSAGVCQDYAHQLIAVLRGRGISARYVVGLMEGEGESHAWVEVYSGGKWYGVDPTHNRLTERGYIKLSHGRDAADCSVTRGVYRGVASHTTEVNVFVERLP